MQSCPVCHTGNKWVGEFHVRVDNKYVQRREDYTAAKWQLRPAYVPAKLFWKNHNWKELKKYEFD